MNASEFFALVDDRLSDGRRYPTLDDYTSALDEIAARERTGADRREREMRRRLAEGMPNRVPPSNRPPQLNRDPNVLELRDMRPTPSRYMVEMRASDQRWYQLDHCAFNDWWGAMSAKQGIERRQNVSLRIRDTRTGTIVDGPPT